MPLPPVLRPDVIRDRIPLLVTLAMMVSAAMMLPALHALARDAHAEARTFFYAGALSFAFIGAIALATARHASRDAVRSQLVALLGSFALLPVLAAVPLVLLPGGPEAADAYVEMVAAATTTGGSVLPPGSVSETVHLWRAIVAWLGGFMIWVAAVAILAPLRLGGFEVTYDVQTGQAARLSQHDQRTAPEERLGRYAAALLPVYLGLTLALAILLAAFGEAPIAAGIRAMSTLSTSGIAPTPGGGAGAAGVPGELAIFAFLFFAVTRQTFAADLHRGQVVRLIEDRELRIALAIVALATAALFLRHFTGAFELTGAAQGPMAALRALWGAAFTILSFLTTTGWESLHWPSARAWSGLDTPAVLLMGLAMFGGGVATTAGGVKLLRLYALYVHGRREMNLLVHPHSVAGRHGAARRVPRRGTEAAWVFFMLFALSWATTTTALAACGLDFRAAVVVAAAGLTTTGPLVDAALGPGGALQTLPDAAKVVWTVAMIVGRLETLALIALFNPDFWRR